MSSHDLPDFLGPVRVPSFEEEGITMADVGFFDSIARDLGGRGMFGGNVQIRLFLQPLLGTLLGIRYGIRDAKRGRRPFLASMVEEKGGHGRKFKESLRDAVLPLCLAFILDSILQYLNGLRYRPLVSVIVGGLLVYLPFMIFRGLANRFWTHRHHGPGSQVPQAP
jgi:hypothetical protein